MKQLFIGLALLVAVVALTPAQTEKEAQTKEGSAQVAQQDPMPVMKMTVRPAATPPPALKYQLLPDSLNQTPGNAAALWRQAAQMVNQNPMTEKQWKWPENTTSLKDLPRKDIRQFLSHHKVTLEIASMAARRQQCDWDYPVLSTPDFLSLIGPEIQYFHQIGNLLSLQIRLQLAEGHFDQALQTLQTGYALAKHVGEGPTLVHSIVGVAIAAIMTGRVDELLQQPGAPNLYWALTILQPQFQDLRKPVQGEMALMYRVFPQLRDVETTEMTPQQAQTLLDDAVRAVQSLTGSKESPIQDKAVVAVEMTRVYPEAKRALIARGRTAAQVEAMPNVQVVAIYMQQQFNERRDEMVKWTHVPYWHGRPGLERALRRFGNPSDPNQKANASMNIQSILFGLALPAFIKAYEAWTRTDRLLCGLRCVEAIRLHAALHDGNLPKTLGDITEVPLPLDPFTGKGFDAWYTFKDGTAVLEIPPPPATPVPALGRRYELTRAP